MFDAAGLFRYKNAIVPDCGGCKIRNESRRVEWRPSLAEFGGGERLPYAFMYENWFRVLKRATDSKYSSSMGTNVVRPQAQGHERMPLQVHGHINHTFFYNLIDTA